MYVRELHVRYRKRCLPGQPITGSLTTPRDAARLLTHFLGREVVEVCGLLCLSSKNELIAYHELSRGTLDGTMVQPRDVFRTALLANAATVVIGHNHPSGVVQPSPDDLALTKRLTAAAELIGVAVSDHIIVNQRGEFFSFRDALLL